jgi:putative transposase
LLPQRYLHGLALGDFELALRGLLGAAAPLSPTSLTRLKAQWQLEYEAWKRRRLDDLEVAILFRTHGDTEPMQQTRCVR